MALGLFVRTTIFRVRRRCVLVPLRSQIVFIILVLLTSLFLKHALRFSYLIYACEIIKALEGTDHVDDVWVHQIRHDLNFMHLSFSVKFVFELLFLTGNRFYRIDLAISLASHFSYYSECSTAKK